MMCSLRCGRSTSLAKTRRSPPARLSGTPALVPHHVLDDRLARLGDLALLPSAIGAVGTELPHLARDLHRDQLVDLVLTLAARRHAASIRPGVRRRRRA